MTRAHIAVRIVAMRTKPAVVDLIAREFGRRKIEKLLYEFRTADIAVLGGTPRISRSAPHIGPKLTRQQLANMTGPGQPDVSRLVIGIAKYYSIERRPGLVTTLGRNVHLV